MPSREVKPPVELFDHDRHAAPEGAPSSAADYYQQYFGGEGKPAADPAAAAEPEADGEPAAKPQVTKHEAALEAPRGLRSKP